MRLRCSSATWIGPGCSDVTTPAHSAPVQGLQQESLHTHASACLCIRITWELGTYSSPGPALTHDITVLVVVGWAWGRGAGVFFQVILVQFPPPPPPSQNKKIDCGRAHEGNSELQLLLQEVGCCFRESLITLALSEVRKGPSVPGHGLWVPPVSQHFCQDVHRSPFWVGPPSRQVTRVCTSDSLRGEPPPDATQLSHRRRRDWM